MAPSCEECPLTVSDNGDTLITGLLLSCSAELSGSLTVELLEVCCRGLILTWDTVLETLVLTEDVAIVTTGSPFTEDRTLHVTVKLEKFCFFLV